MLEVPSGLERRCRTTATAPQRPRRYATTSLRTRLIRTPDTEIGTDAVGALAAPGVSAESISLTAPSTPGTYYYGACMDAVAGESDTTNNCSGSIAVEVSE